MTISARIYADLIGKTFSHGGRGPSAYDCVGLAIEVERRLDVRMPEFISDAAELHRQVASGGWLSQAWRIEVAEGGCIALMKGSTPAERHIGIMLDSFRMIHASEAAGSVVIENLSRSYWGRRVVGFYRMESAQ